MTKLPMLQVRTFFELALQNIENGKKLKNYIYKANFGNFVTLAFLLYGNARRNMIGWFTVNLENDNQIDTKKQNAHILSYLWLKI